MPDYTYLALDERGRERQGRMAAPSNDAVQARLAERRFYVVKVEESGSDGKSLLAAALPAFGNRLNAKALALFTRQLASLITVSPLEEALRTIARQSEKEQVRNIVSNVHAGVLEGQRLSEAMRREPRSFPPLYRAMIAAGENSGSLPAIAERLAQLLERQAEMRTKLVSTLAYPSVLALVAVAVVVGLMVSVVPSVVEQFDTAAAQLPLVTRIVIGLSGFLAAWWWAIAAILLLLGLVFWRALGQPAFRYRFDAFVLRLPLVGRLVRDMHAARMARTLSTMVASRLPVLEGLKLTVQTVNNRVLREATEQVVEAIRTGGSLSGALRATGVFPPLLVYLAASGESAGQLDVMLERAADYLERELDGFTTAALAILEPAIIVLMGGIVGLIILSILLPILQMQSMAAL